ncbi:MAG: hypothetical protein AAFN74_19165, partial [Myxococcota bacterium]
MRPPHHSVALSQAGSSDLARKVDDERVRLLFERGWVALATVLINATLLIWVLADQIAAWILGTWALALVIITAGRTALSWWYVNSGPQFDALVWERAFAAGALLNGAAWGLGTATFLSADPEYQIGVLFVVGGMVAGASSSSATSPLSFMSYTVTASIPVLYTLLTP